ncbi:MAG: 1-aminocyclopropane-1-carboxylate deaminase [Arcobacteraceae bacterium]|jgi:1-aminocyclopropane-1-carboxylate deaminase
MPAMNIKNSPIEEIKFQEHSFLIKRDDLLDKDFSGNKARKFLYFLEHDFPNITKLISHGSNQSNAMYSLSVLCKLRNWEFIYYTNRLPSYLKENPQGNYKYALENDMKLFVNGDFYSEKLIINDSTLFIEEGGALEEANYGIKALAEEITKYIKNNNIPNLKVFLPSGTGTTALFLQKNLDIEVLTCACVGDEIYLKKQFLELEANESKHPTILKTKKKYHFGKLYKENYEIWNELKEQTTVEFDLLYDPIGWNTMLDNIDENYTYLYIHQGGLIGNESMIQRYIYKYKL